MLTIRFQRKGRKNNPSFKVVVLEKARSPKAGNPLEVVGSYNPRTKATVLNEARIKHWVSVGAEVSGTAHNLFITKGLMQGKKINVLGRKNPPKKEEEVKTEEPKVEPEKAVAVEAPQPAE